MHSGVETTTHENVIEFKNEREKLHGFIAIHSTVLGSAVGGTRLFPYPTREAALADVLKLSQAMTYKCAIAGVNFGGGKGVIIANPKTSKTPQLLRAYAEEVNNLRGKFYTGEDVGMDEHDIAILKDFSPYIIGSQDKAGDPSPYAGLSTYTAMKSAAEFIFGSHSLERKRIVVKGLGKVGISVIGHLVSENVKLFASDIDSNAIVRAKFLYPGIEIVTPNEIQNIECDIYCPCAMGNEFTKESAEQINTKIICGGANNQLVDREVGAILFKRNIIYVPDYVSNCGGLINVVDELYPNGYNPGRVRVNIAKIDGLVQMILKRSKAQGIPPNEITDSMVLEVLDSVKKNGHRTRN